MQRLLNGTADCETPNERAAVVSAVWSINKGSDWAITDSILGALTVNLPQ